MSAEPHRHGLFVTGTDTDVGKTHVTATLAAAIAARGMPVRALKPLATGGAPPGDDAERLGRAAGHAPWVHRCLPTPASPDRAARLAGEALEPEAVLDATLAAMCPDGPSLVEGVGGWAVPLAGRYRCDHLAQALGLPVLIVAANRLGVLSHTLLTADAVRAAGLPLVGVVLNDGAPGATSDPNLRDWNHADLEAQGLGVWRLAPGPAGTGGEALLAEVWPVWGAFLG